MIDLHHCYHFYLDLWYPNDFHHLTAHPLHNNHIRNNRLVLLLLHLLIHHTLLLLPLLLPLLLHRLLNRPLYSHLFRRLYLHPLPFFHLIFPPKTHFHFRFLHYHLLLLVHYFQSISSSFCPLSFFSLSFSFKLLSQFRSPIFVPQLFLSY